MLNYKRINAKFLLVIVFFICACKHNVKTKKENQFISSDFKLKRELKGQAINLDKAKSLIDIQIIPSKNILIVADIDNYFLKVYRLDNFKYLKSFAEKGIGKNQLILCRAIQYDERTQLLYATDTYKEKIFVYSVDSISDAKAKILPIDSIQLQGNNFNRPLVTSNGKIVDICGNYKSKNYNVLSFYSKNGAFLNSTGRYPITDIKYSPLEINFAFSSGLNISNLGSDIVCSYYYTDVLDVYDSIGNLKKRMQGPDIFSPNTKSVNANGGTFNVATSKTQKGYVGKAYMNKDDLLVLYDGKINNKNFHSNILLNFTSSLSPKTENILDIPIFTFATDWNKKIIYGIWNNENGCKLVQYQF